MNSYSGQEKGIRLFNNLNKDVPLFWIWTVGDFLSICISLFFLSGAGMYLTLLFALILFTIVVPTVRRKYGVRTVFQRICINFGINLFKVYVPRGKEKLRD